MIICTKICWYWTRIVGVIWKCNRGPVFLRHSVVAVANDSLDGRQLRKLLVMCIFCICSCALRWVKFSSPCDVYFVIVFWWLYLGSCLQLAVNCDVPEHWSNSDECVAFHSGSADNSSTVTVYHWPVGPRLCSSAYSVCPTVDSTLSSCTQSFHTDSSSC